MMAGRRTRSLAASASGKTRSWPGMTAAAVEEVTVPDTGGPTLRARLRAPPLMGGLPPVHRSHIPQTWSPVSLWPPSACDNNPLPGDGGGHKLSN